MAYNSRHEQPTVCRLARTDRPMFARSLIGHRLGRRLGRRLGVVWGIGGALVGHWFPTSLDNCVMAGEARTYLLG